MKGVAARLRLAVGSGMGWRGGAPRHQGRVWQGRVRGACCAVRGTALDQGCWGVLAWWTTLRTFGFKLSLGHGFRFGFKLSLGHGFRFGFKLSLGHGFRFEFKLSLGHGFRFGFKLSLGHGFRFGLGPGVCSPGL
eukprot:scaffold22497_cov103-Isochrysis_galbana.AAC.3